jgi:hypothetical protein
MLFLKSIQASSALRLQYLLKPGVSYNEVTNMRSFSTKYERETSMNGNSTISKSTKFDSLELKSINYDFLE